MLFFRLFRQCLQTTNNNLILVSRRLQTTNAMFSKNKKNGVPDRWLDYRAVGGRIPGTRFIAFKVPLRPGLTRQVPPSEAFGPWDLLDALRENGQELGLIVDLTFTTRYYKLHDLPESLLFIKIFTEGHQVPSDQTILSFKRAVRHFLRENPDNDKLIGVHCTHGLNRTGYLVCRYLIDVDGFNPVEAVKLFNSSRGHRIERQNYLDDLQSGPRRSNEGMDQSEQDPMRGLAVTRPECLPIGEDRQLTRPQSVPIGQDRQQWSRTDGHAEAVRQRAAPNQSWGRGVNHQSHPRGGGTNWSHHREVHHQSWRGETNQSHSRRGGSNQSHPRGGTNQSHPRGGTNQSHPRGGTNQSHRGPPRGQGFPPVAPPHQGFPRGGDDGLLPPPPPPQWIHPSRAGSAHHRGRSSPPPPPPQWIHPSRAGSAHHRGRSSPPPPPQWIHPSRAGSAHHRGRSSPPPPPQWIHPSRAGSAPHHGGRPSGTKRPMDRPSSRPNHDASPSFQREEKRKKSRDHRHGPPGPSHLPRYAPTFPPEHE